MSSTLVDDSRDRAFERLYERYVRDVHRYVLTLVRNPAEAEDVTQTTFLNAYRALQAGEQPLRPRNWLIAIAHNACRSRARRSMRRPREVPLDDVVSQLAVPEPERPNIRELLRALGRLPFNQRTALTMRELEGRSYPEIAETLGVSVGAVEALIARARRTLRLQASTLRGLTVLQLPRSLRTLFETGEAAVGAGALAKVAAVLVAGAVAGGIGGAIVEARPPAAPRTPSVQSWQHVLASPAGTFRAPVETAGRLRASAVRARSATPAHTGTIPGPDAVAPAASASSGQAGPQAQPQAEPQQHQVVATVQQTASDAVQTVTATATTLPLSQPAVPPVPTPPVDVPTVAVPTVPEPPALTPPPALPPPPELPPLPPLP